MPLTRSLKLRLPVLIVALLGVIIVAFAWSAHRELTRTFERAAGVRLQDATARLAQMLDDQMGRLRRDVNAVGSNPAVVAAFTSSTPAARQAAAQALAWQGTPAATPPSRSLWTLECRSLLSVGPELGRSRFEDCPTFRAGATGRTAASAPGAWIQPFAVHDGAVTYGAVASVLGASGDTLGFLVERRVLGGRQAGGAIAALIGRDASVMLGNATGVPVWTDLSRKIDGPMLPAARGVPMTYTPADGARQIGVAQDVAATPWVVLVQLPAATVLAPERELMRTLLLVALACLVLGALGALAVGWHVTTPLAQIARAADGLAQGDYGRRVEIGRRDEMGTLMTSFNRMASEVEASSRTLREQAMELEMQANESQNLAHELELSNQELSEALEEATRARQDRVFAESLLDEVLVQAPVGMAVFDREMRYVRLNQAVADIHGTPIAEHLGRRPGEVMASLGEAAEPMLRRVLETGEKVPGHRLSATLDGGMKRHWLASLFPIRSSDGDITGVGAVLVDTTTQRELEAQLLQAQKMEAVGRLAGGIAHDFNNLLTVITSYSSLALDVLRAEDPLHDDMREIRDAAERAARLTAQLLAFSRKQVMRPQPLDLSAVTIEMQRMLQRLIGEDIALELRLSADLGVISADPGQLEQVIMNLAVNARDAMPQGGRLLIETANVSLAGGILRPAESDIPSGDYVVLTVSDTGTGMSESTLGKLFEPFFTTKAAGQGTGLGLSTVYGIVKQSGGELKVRSSMGQGSTFRIYFPRISSDQPDADRVNAAREHARGGTETILLVEDDEPLRQLAARVLRSAGYTVLDTRNPTDAVRTGTYYDGVIDLLLTDVVMPEMSGRAVSEQLGRHRPAMRVLYMSGYTDDDVVRRGILTTRTALLQKPFTPDQLARHVRQALDDRTSALVASD